MIDRLRDLPAGVDGLRARGKVTKEDCEGVLQPILDEARSQGRRIRLLYHFGPEFEGFTTGGAWEDARLGLRYLRLFERCAIVSDIRWVRESSRLVGAITPCPVKVFGNGEWQDVAPRLAEHFVTAEIKHFEYDDLDRAIVWASGRADR